MTFGRGPRVATGRRTGGHVARLLVIALVALLAGATSAAAAPVVDSWSLTPTGTNPNEPGSRPAFTYTLAPGAAVRDSLTVWNYSDVQLTFHVYAADAFNTAADGFDLAAADQRPTDVGAWIRIEQNYVTLPAHSKVSLAFVVHVPANATPGDHAGGIVAASVTGARDQQGKHVVLDRRVGSRVYLRVSGPVHPALVVEHLSTTYHSSANPLGGSVDVTYTVRNAGNVRLGTQQLVVLRDVFGKVGNRALPELAELLPGAAITTKAHFDGVSATIRLSGTVTLTPFVPREAPSARSTGSLSPTTATAHTWAIPWSLLIALLLLSGLIALFRRRRPAESEPPDEEPAPRQKVGVA